MDEVLFGMNRDVLISALQAENVMARKYFNPLCYEIYDNILDKGRSLKNTELLAMKIIQLPIGALVDDSDIYGICDLFKSIHVNHESILKAVSGGD